MKYKNIDSMLHNFGDSFVSLLNYFDDTYIVDLIPDVLRGIENHRLTIHFPSGEVEPQSTLPEPFKKSIQHYSNWLPKHVAAHGLEIKRILKIRLELRAPSTKIPKLSVGFDCRVFCSDDRGSDHKVTVK